MDKRAQEVILRTVKTNIEIQKDYISRLPDHAWKTQILEDLRDAVDNIYNYALQNDIIIKNRMKERKSDHTSHIHVSYGTDYEKGLRK